MTDQNGPRHGDDAVYDPNPDTAYDDEYAMDAGAAGAGAAGTTGAAGADVAGGPPLRGLAMVLTAVAVVLIAWGVYSFVGGDDGDDSTQDTVAGQDASGAAQDGSGRGADGASSATDAADAEDGEGTDAASDDRDNGDDPADSADPDDPAAPDAARNGGDPEAAGNSGGGGGAPGVDRGTTAVTVLNNSGEPVAQSTADRLRGEQWTNVGYGNLRGRIDGISEESRVYYPEGNAESQAAAEQVAGDLGITAAPGNPDYYDRFGEADVRTGPRADGVVVVLTGPL
ncbi:LytR C-terminal domain-containing protein [Corynebacterium sp.]|uniref:LytR C-terminal domain-containing protein n=1 Tax=Corynebacterium sp. TaxID=1720 RepID=UPI003B3B36D5